MNIRRPLFNGEVLLCQLSMTKKRYSTSQCFRVFTWDSCNHMETVSGESKKEYQHKLSEAMRFKGGSGGFGMEMNQSLNETDFTETYKTYTSVYEIQHVYTLKVNETDTTKLQKHLTPHALEVFREKDPSDIVDIFGTHYMTQAGFGGLKRMLSVLDIREENVSTDFAIWVRITTKHWYKGRLFLQHLGT